MKIIMIIKTILMIMFGKVGEKSWFWLPSSFPELKAGMKVVFASTKAFGFLRSLCQIYCAFNNTSKLMTKTSSWPLTLSQALLGSNPSSSPLSTAGPRSRRSPLMRSSQNCLDTKWTSKIGSCSSQARMDLCRSLSFRSTKTACLIRST